MGDRQIKAKEGTQREQIDLRVEQSCGGGTSEAGEVKRQLRLLSALLSWAFWIMCAIASTQSRLCNGTTLFRHQRVGNNNKLSVIASEYSVFRPKYGV